MAKETDFYHIGPILPATESILQNDVMLVVMYAARIPPHLALIVNGKVFTLTVKGPMVDSDLQPFLKLIRSKQIATIFIRLSLPVIFTIDQLNEQIRKYTLAYPRVDIGIATCLNPIRDFCSSVYETDVHNVNFIFDLLPKLYQQNLITSCYQLNLDSYMSGNSFILRKYTMNDIYEGIRGVSILN